MLLLAFKMKFGIGINPAKITKFIANRLFWNKTVNIMDKSSKYICLKSYLLLLKW